MMGLIRLPIEVADGSYRTDAVLIEEPLEIRIVSGEINNRRRDIYAVTMRTPGDEFAQAVGLLAADGVIEDLNDVLNHTLYKPNELMIELHPDVVFDSSLAKRTGYSTASCGVCGRHSVDTVCERIRLVTSECEATSKIILGISNSIREHQSLFLATGGCHAAALFDSNGRFDSLFEDVGRHNALDKLLGNAFLTCRWPLKNSIILLSGRSSFEMIQKASAAGVPILVSVGAPTSLAVSLAERIGITLVGFVRGTDFNVYSHGKRISQ